MTTLAPELQFEVLPRMSFGFGLRADDPRPHHVYICRHKNGSPLYVGISLNAMERMAHHSHRSRWFKWVTHIEIERRPNRMAALEREKHLIQTLFPTYNTQHVDRVATVLHYFRQVPEDQQLDVVLSLFRKLSSEAQVKLLVRTLNGFSDEQRAELRTLLENPEHAPTVARIREASK